MSFDLGDGVDEQLNRSLRNISIDVSSGGESVQCRAETPTNSTKMSGVGERGFQFEFTSPESKYSGVMLPMSPNMGRSQVSKKLNVFKKRVPTGKDVMKRGAIRVIGQDVYHRAHLGKKRSRTQKSVMGGVSARDEVRDYIRRAKDQPDARVCCVFGGGQSC